MCAEGSRPGGTDVPGAPRIIDRMKAPGSWRRARGTSRSIVGAGRVVAGTVRAFVGTCLAVLGGGFTVPAAAGGAVPTVDALPAPVAAALQRAQLPPEALVAWVAEVGPQAALPRLAHRAREPVNPASLTKLYTTGAALEMLGPAWTWTTPLLATGPIEGGVLRGDLAIQGRGDPSLVVERVWLMLRQLRQRGVQEVRGDIVLDGRGFAAGDADPAAFDGERFRPYNVQPDALLLNLKSITLGFVPDAARGVARVTADVVLAGVQVDAEVPLAPGDCGDWRGALKADFADPARLRLAGRYPASCGEKAWPIAYADPASYNARLVEGLWRELGGRLAGKVREGAVPAGAQPLFEFASPPLAAVVRDINKFSNNVMAQQLFLTLGATFAPPPADAAPTDGSAAARRVLAAYVADRIGCSEPELRIDNGSGLSRRALSSAHCLGAWLQALWASPVLPELMASLPVGGVDGTARRAGRLWGVGLGRTHLKTGSLRDTAGLAGYVLGASGRRYAFVAVLSHPNAQAGRPALDALVQWAAEDQAP